MSKEFKPNTVCYCMGITENELIELSEKRKSFIEVKNLTGLSTACGRCEDHAREICKKSKDK